MHFSIYPILVCFERCLLSLSTCKDSPIWESLHHVDHHWLQCEVHLGWFQLIPQSLNSSDGLCSFSCSTWINKRSCHSQSQLGCGVLAGGLAQKMRRRRMTMLPQSHGETFLSVNKGPVAHSSVNFCSGAPAWLSLSTSERPYHAWWPLRSFRDPWGLEAVLWETCVVFLSIIHLPLQMHLRTV